MEDGITYVTLHRKYRGSTVIWRDDCAFCLESENSDFRTSVLDNRELIENHIILTYYEGNKLILRLLDVLLSAETKPEEKKSILENDFDIPMTKSMSEEANTMCNLGEGIREKTEINSKTESIINLMDSMDIDVEKAMNLLKINPKDYDVYKKSVEDVLCVK